MERLPRDVARRFWRKFRRAQVVPEIPGKNFSVPCLLWEGGTDNKGYGVFRAYDGCMGLPSGLVRVHRFVMWLREGPFPRNIQVDHECRVKNCGEYTHLKKLGPVEHAVKSNNDRWHGSGYYDDLEEEILEDLL